MTEENFSMMKTIIIAVCSAVAYLAVVIGLTVYCSIRLVKAKNLRKMANDTQPVQTGGMTNHGNMAGGGSYYRITGKKNTYNSRENRDGRTH